MFFSDEKSENENSASSETEKPDQKDLSNNKVINSGGTLSLIHPLSVHSLFSMPAPIGLIVEQCVGSCLT